MLKQIDENGQVISVVSLESDDGTLSFNNLTSGNYVLTATQGNYQLQENINITEPITAVTTAFERLSELRVQIADLEKQLKLLLYDAASNLVDVIYVSEDGTATFQDNITSLGLVEDIMGKQMSL